VQLRPSIYRTSLASAKTAMCHNWSGGCPEYHPECPLLSMDDQVYANSCHSITLPRRFRALPILCNDAATCFCICQTTSPSEAQSTRHLRLYYRFYSPLYPYHPHALGGLVIIFRRTVLYDLIFYFVIQPFSGWYSTIMTRISY
jgi:hypothetical protein